MEVRGPVLTCSRSTPRFAFTQRKAEFMAHRMVMPLQYTVCPRLSISHGTCRGRPVMSNSHDQPELIDLDTYEGPELSSAPARPRRSLASHPLASLLGAASFSPARHAARHSHRASSSAGPSRHTGVSSLVPVIDLSESEAAAGLPPMHRRKKQSQHNTASLANARQEQAIAEATASGQARDRSAKRRMRQDELETDSAAPVWLDMDNVIPDVNLKKSASAAPKRYALGFFLENLASLKESTSYRRPRRIIPCIFQSISSLHDTLHIGD